MRRSVLAVACLVFLAVGPLPVLRAQQDATGKITGTVEDPHGSVVSNASVEVKTESPSLDRKTTTGADGHFSVEGLPTGSYTVEVSAPNFSVNSRTGVQVSAGKAIDISITLSIESMVQSLTVTANAEDSPSIASHDSPVKAVLEETSATSVIDAHYIQNFASPLADFGELVQMVPGTFTVNPNGVGLGQSSTYFRGFPDGDYDIDFDGIPFYDTNTPTHHSWAFFPSQWIGGVDFDRSPGTASTIGPTPFGGNIHLLSRDMPTDMNIRGSVAYGSFNTKLYDAEFDSANFGPANRSDLTMDWQRMTSDGYQTFNYQMRNAGAFKYTFRVSDRTIITAFSGIDWLNSNTPNFKGPTRAQITINGPNFLMTDDSNPTLYTDYQYNYYFVPTDFEYVGLKSDLGRGWLLDVKPYTYQYDNKQKYANAVTLAEPSCDTAVTKKGVTAIPCGVDKRNEYRKFGQTSSVSQSSKKGIFRAGFWNEFATTNRFQIPSDPLNNWADQLLPNFHENFVTNSYQAFVEYLWHALPRLNVTAGIKFVAYTIDVRQYADDGKTIGDLNGAEFIKNVGRYQSYLPAVAANYRLRSNWSVYGQYAKGSVVPPSSVFDYNQTVSSSNLHPGIETYPTPTSTNTIQTGTVLKLQRLTVDADYYHIWFQNPYSTVTDPDTGEQDFYLAPSSITRGVEAEANLYIGHGVSAYLNGTDGKATYTGSQTVSGVLFQVPPGLWVAQTPSNTEAGGLTYQHKAWDLGIFDKRIGPEWEDNGSYHNQVPISPFSFTDMFLGYTIRGRSRFNQTQIRLSFNNLFDQHDITSVTPTGSVISPTTSGVTNPFLGTTALSGTDVMNILPGRSIMLSVIFGFSPKNR
jgi:iron complex outermembrane receptor protein